MAPVPPDRPLSIETVGADDIIAVAEQAHRATGLEKPIAIEMVVGLRLLANVVLRENHNSLFDPLREGLRAFIGGLNHGAAREG